MDIRMVPAKDLKSGMVILEKDGTKILRFRVIDTVPRQMGSEVHVSVKDNQNNVRMWRYSVPALVQVA